MKPIIKKIIMIIIFSLTVATSLVYECQCNKKDAYEMSFEVIKE